MKITALKDLIPAKIGQHPVYAVVADDAYDRKQATGQILTHLAPEEEQGLTVFDAASCEWSAVMGELNSVPFFVDKLVVHLRAVDKLSKPQTEELLGYVNNPTPKIHLVMEAEALRSNSALAKAVESKGLLLALAKEKEWAKEKALPQWIQEHVQSLGKQIDTNAAHQLAQWIGTDKQLLHSEIDKLICYIDERPNITGKDIETLCVPTKPESGFKLSDAVFARNGPEALRLTRKSLDDGVQALALLRQLRQQFATKAELLTLAPEAVKQRFPYMTDWIQKQNRQTAQTYGYQALLKGIRAIDDAELTAKSSDASGASILDSLVHKLVSNS